MAPEGSVATMAEGGETPVAPDAAGGVLDAWGGTGTSAVLKRWAREAWDAASDPASRAAQAAAKSIEFAVTGLQAETTRKLALVLHAVEAIGFGASPEAFDATWRAQSKARDDALMDAWRLLSKRDIEQVRNRITEATLGTASLPATADEHLHGEGALLAFARTMVHFNTAAAEVTVGMATGGATAAVAATKSALSLVRSPGGGVMNAVKQAARALPRTVDGWVDALRAGQRPGTSGAARTAAEAAEGGTLRNALNVSVHGGGGFPTRIKDGVLQVLKPSKGGAGPNRWHNVVEEAAEGLTMQERASRVAAGVLRRPSELAESVLGILPLNPQRLTPLHRLSRFVATATQEYDRATPILRLLKKLPGVLGKWEQSHLAIQAQWFRAGSKFALFPEGSRAIVGLRALGQAGFNLAPLPTFINQGLKNSPWLMSALGLTIDPHPVVLDTP